MIQFACLRACHINENKDYTLKKIRVKDKKRRDRGVRGVKR